MNISRKTDYALRILLKLANDRGKTYSVRKLAEEHKVPYAFARTIQRELCSFKLIRSSRGAKGGVALMRPAEEITLFEVVQYLQGSITCAACTIDQTWCDQMPRCQLRRVWEEVDDLIANYLKKITLADLLRGDSS